MRSYFCKSDFVKWKTNGEYHELAEKNLLSKIVTGVEKKMGVCVIERHETWFSLI